MTIIHVSENFEENILAGITLSESTETTYMCVSFLVMNCISLNFKKIKITYHFFIKILIFIKLECKSVNIFMMYMM